MLQPREFVMMLEGLSIRREYDRAQHTESLYLLRFIATSLVNFAQGFSEKGKAIDQTDIWSIPELDPILFEKREEEREKFEKRAEAALEKYRRIGRRHAKR